MKTNILVTGACGQIGTALVKALREKYRRSHIIATDIRPKEFMGADECYRTLNVLSAAELERLVDFFDVTHIYHLAAVLSANGEKEPLASWDLNMKGLLNVLEVSREYHIEKVFWPSSIAVFGPGSMPAVCFQNSKTDPTTVYGISKVAGESWCRYYNTHYGLDTRSLRYPGLISHSAPAGGGTTDYAVDIFHQALSSGSYQCFLKETTALPMMYMDDAIRATLELMDADKKRLTVNDSYNIAAMSFTPGQLAAAIRKHRDLAISYVPDARQHIADNWPQSINDRQARQDWGWDHHYELEAMTQDMFWHLKQDKKQIAEV